MTLGSKACRGLWILVPIGVLTLGEDASAATPTYFDDRMEFEATLTAGVVDDYTNGGYANNQSDVQMSAVLGETDYNTTGHPNTNLVVNMMGGDPRYCAGCNGSFRLTFTSTSVGTADGVDAVGFDIDSSDNTYYAFIRFADGDTEDVFLPAFGSFWGVSAPEQIESIHIGLMNETTTTNGYIEIDNLTIGSVGPQLCDNGEIDEGEDCDEGGETATCDGNCTFVSCGDGDFNATAGESCDDGGDSAECDVDCTPVECGDLYVNTVAEVCDDGQGETAECDADCTAVVCGDTTLNVTAGETCDDGGDTLTCDFDCTPVECGDGYVNGHAGEDCDTPAESESCDADCTEVVCGDGVINTTAGELCDDATESAECDPDCTAAECGDGLLNATAGEDCDGDNNGTPGETAICDADCTAAECGDGFINEARDEECDDSNVSDGDGCSSLCLVEEGGSTGDEESGSSTGDGEESGSGDASSTGESATTEPLPVDPDSSTEGVDGSDTDTDTGGAAGDGDGCGCTSSPRDGRGFLAFILLALAFRRRRRAA